MAKKTMKLGEALALLKSKKSRLAQLQSKRLSTFYNDEKKKPQFTYTYLTAEIKKESNQIEKLKLAIIEANLKSKLPNGRSIQEGILKVGEYRSALGNLQAIMDREPSRRYLLDEKEVPQVPQEKLAEIDKVIQELSYKKATYDNAIQEANWQFEVTVEL